MLYWLTGTAGTSAYVTYIRAGGWGPEPDSGVPTGVLLTPIDWAIRRYSEPSHTITRWTELDHGGHFAALEIPTNSAPTSESSFETRDPDDAQFAETAARSLWKMRKSHGVASSGTRCG